MTSGWKLIDINGDVATMTLAQHHHPALERPNSGWFPDPIGEHHLRYHDGMNWTAHVTHYGPTPCTGCHEIRLSSGPLPSTG
jgi:hypothetical protein